MNGKLIETKMIFNFICEWNTLLIDIDPMIQNIAQKVGLHKSKINKSINIDQ